MFERFRQLEGGATRRVGGTGLGLSIAREFAVLHHGSISIAEAPEGGALFAVDLPRTAPAGVVVRPRVEATAKNAEVQRAVEELRPRRREVAPAAGAARALVLVVEDNPEMNRFIAENLASDYRVEVAFDGKEGLEKAKALGPDVIVTDVMMPRMSGDEMVRAIRGLPELHSTPIIVLTAKADDVLRVRLLREGAQDYLTKPFSVDELRARVANFVSKKLADEAARRANDAVAALFEQAPDGVFVTDADGRAVDVNPAGCRILGYPRDEIVGKSMLEFVRAVEPERVSLTRHRLLAGGTHVGQWTLTRKDGSQVPVEISAKFLRDGRCQVFVRDITTRKQLESELRQRHEDLIRAQSVAKVGSWRLDVRHNVLLWSDENYRIFGVAHGTPMTYEGFLACVHPDDRAFVDREWTAALHGKQYDIEHRVVADGTVKWVREKADLEFTDDGALAGGIGITQDITERKQYEQEIHEARERHELALRGADLGAWDWNIQTGEVVFNARWAEMRGYRLDELRGHVDTWTAGVHPEDLPRVQRTLDDYFHGRVAEYDCEHRVRTKSGRWIWILDRGKVFARNERGEPIRMVGTELDITARKRAEDELRLLAEVSEVFGSLEYEETLKSIARLAVRELADFCLVDVLIDGELRAATVECRDSGESRLCQMFREIRIDRARPHLTRQVFETKRPVLIERVTAEMLESHAQSDQHLRAMRALDPKSMILTPLLAHGELLGILILVSSSESRVYGPDDVRLAEELATRAALAIDNARLYQEAMRATRAREELLGIVAHDLRNPLGTILMQSSMLRRSAEGLQQKPAQVIERAATRMNRLIQDLLDVTRIEAGRLSIEQARLPATQVVFDACDGQRSLASSASVEIRCDVAASLPDVFGDRDRLQQVFENLIGNAVKFTKAGGSITVGAAPRGSEVLFWVADTGAGIAHDDLPHVFDRFWQATETKRAGAGLGLSIVKGIVEAHGGRVWAESTLGRGSIFFFTVPTSPRAEQWRSEHVH